MWLEVVASYDGAPVWTSGLWIDGQGLDRDPQVRTYEAIADEYASGTTLHLLRNDHWVTDTRLPPAGLVGDVQTDPVGTRYAMQPDGTWPNFDVAPYAFDAAPAVVDATPADPADDVLDVQVRLVYVINTRQYVQFLADENQTNDAGIDVATTFDAAGGSPPMEIAAASLQIPIVGFGATGTSGGVDDTAGPATGPSTTGPATSAGVGSEATGADAGADDDSGGCGCTTNGRPVTAGWLALGCFVLASRRRRRR
jgi:hypothetical protein